MFFWAYILMGLTALAAYWNWRAALAFFVALCVAMIVTAVGSPYTGVYFFASYACIGVLSFFLWDKIAGALLCVVSLPSFAHAIGLIEQMHRDYVGEFLFALGLLFTALSGPSGGYADRVAPAFLRRGSDSRAGVFRSR